MERYFHVSFHALILAGFIAIARTGRLDIISVLVFAVCFVGSTNQAFRNKTPLVSGRGAFWFSLAYIIFFPFDGLILSRSFVSAVIHMILFLTGIKLAQEKRDKDYLHLVLLSFLLVLAASSLTIDMSFVFTLLLYVVALVSTLMSFEIHRSQRSTPGSTAPGIAWRLSSMSVWTTAWIVVVGLRARGLFGRKSVLEN